MSVLERVETEPLVSQPLILPLYTSKEAFGWSTLRDYNLQQMAELSMGEYELLEIPLEPNIEVNLDNTRETLRNNTQVLPHRLNYKLQTLFEDTVFADWAEPFVHAGWGWKEILADGFSDSQLLTFIDWNINQTSEKQAMLEQKLPAIIARFTSSINEGINAGWLPTHVSHRLSMLNSVDFYVGDIFMTEAAGNCGYYKGNLDDSGMIVVSSMKVEDDADLEPLLFHEMTHAITGVGWWKHVNEKEGWLNEALTEHISQALLGLADFNDLTNRTSEFYHAERKLLHEVTKRISEHWLLNLYFTDKSDQHAFVGGAVDRLFGNLEFYDTQVSIYETTDDGHEKVEAMQRLTNFAKVKNMSHTAVQAARR